MKELSIILPCQNEEATIGICIKKIKQVFENENINGEVIVSDSSKDNSARIARDLGAEVIEHGKDGYGIACLEGLKKATGKFLVIGDADDTYDFLELPKFLNALRKGYDFVIGSRIKGDIKKGAMPFSHRYIGNPLLSYLLSLFFKTKVSDAHCGFRAFRRDILEKLNLCTAGMEFASETIINVAKNKLSIKEIPISYYPRKGKSKLKSFSDGWRHLRFMLMYSPSYLFLAPGIFLFAIGFLVLLLLLRNDFIFLGLNMAQNHMFLGALFTILGYQIMSIGLYAKVYAIVSGFEKRDKIVDFIAKHIPLERGLIIGLTIFALAFLSCLFIFFSNLGNIRFILFGLTLLSIGLQTIFSAFFLSILLVEKK
ncbi:dolichol-P-glucose synthetase [archaeon]|nr:dolichol-P-glucose synthetase [archaeon]